MPTRRLVLAAVLSLVPFAGTTPALAVGIDGYITRAEALARTSVLRPTGTYTTQYPGNPNTYRLPLRPTTWDLSNWTSINYDAFSSDGTSYPLIFGGGRLQVAAPKPVTIGGTVLGQNPASWTWDNWYKRDFGSNCTRGLCPNPRSAGAAEYMTPAADGYGVSYDFTAVNVFDFFTVRPENSTSRPTFKLSGCEGRNVRDDAIENDWSLTGKVDDCLFDGVFQGVSLGQSAGNSSAVLTIQDSVFVFRDFPHDDTDNDQWYVSEDRWCRDLDEPLAEATELCTHGKPDPSGDDGSGHGRMFKMVNNDLDLHQFGAVDMENVTICYEETPIENSTSSDWNWPENGSMYHDVTVVLGKARPTLGRSGYDGDADGVFTDLDLRGNPGSPPPSGITQTRDWTVCKDAIAGWHAAHPGR